MFDTPTSSGAIRLSKDFSKLVNNPVGSDIRFLVGGASPSSSVNAKQSDIPTATFYAHSLILRFRSKYFAALYDNEWKEISDGVFKKPNVSPAVFHALLYYIYTGSVEVDDSSLLPELIAAAEEMGLDELSITCQSRLIKELDESSKNIGKDNEDEINATKKFEHGKLPFGLAVHTLLIPALILAYDHTLEIFYEELLDFVICRIETIITSKNTFNMFLEKIPIAIFKQILAADALSLNEYDVWQLTLSWACHKTKLMKSAVETQLRLNAEVEDYEDDSIDEPPISTQQLKTLKSEISPLLPTIRFTLMKHEQYSKTIETLNYFVPSRRLHEIQRFFSRSGNTSQEVARAASKGISGSMIATAESVQLLRQWIRESNVNHGLSLSDHLNFRLLYRASVHGYQAYSFHSHCDNQGPTLVLVRSSNGRLFGGVNFASWTSNCIYSASEANFLFSLTQSMIFPCTHTNYAAYDNYQNGPVFGNDLAISDNANYYESTSNMPQYYGGTGASNTILAGTYSFVVADYEVYLIL